VPQVQQEDRARAGKGESWSRTSGGDVAAAGAPHGNSSGDVESLLDRDGHAVHQRELASGILARDKDPHPYPEKDLRLRAPEVHR